MVEVAQSVEHQVVALGVADSISVFHPIRRRTQEAEEISLEN